MSTTDQDLPGRGASTPWCDLALTFAALGLGVATLLAWVLPVEKNFAIFGRFNYVQTLATVVLGCLFVATTVLLFTPARRRRRRTFRLATVGLTTSVVLLLAEAAAWLLPIPQPEDNPWYLHTAGAGSMMQQSDQLMFERPPHLHWRGLSQGDFATGQGYRDPYARYVTFKTDHEGFRNHTDQDQADVVFIGDSHTEAGNMPEAETFVARTGEALGVSVRNLGRACHGPSEEWILLERYGLKCRPQVVVWQFCDNNDLEEEVLFRWWNDNGRPRIAEFQNHLTRTDAWESRSPTYRLFRRLRRAEPWEFRGNFQDAGGDQHPMLFEKPPDGTNCPVRHPGWPLMAQTLRKGAEQLKRQNVDLIVIHIPKKIRVMGHSVKFPDYVLRRLPEDWDLNPDQTLASYLDPLCRELGVPFIDLTELLKRFAADGEMVYLPMDSHLSSRGHAVVAEELADAIAALDGSSSTGPRTELSDRD